MCERCKDNDVIWEYKTREHSHHRAKYCPACGKPLTEAKPLSLDELIERDKPVYVPLDNGDGYWCLCINGYITPPSLLEFFAGDRPSWVFYDREPRREEAEHE